MEASIPRSLRLLVALLLVAAVRAASLAANEGSPSKRPTYGWRPTHEARGFKRVEVPKPKGRILVVDCDRGTPQAEFFTQRAAA